MKKGFKVICDILETIGAIVLGTKAVLMIGEASLSAWYWLIIANMIGLALIFAVDVGIDFGKKLIELAER